jgi:hypothetical protein
LSVTSHAGGARSPAAACERTHGGEPVAPRLHQNIDNYAVLIHDSPEIMPLAIAVEEDFIQMPFVACPGPFAPQACRKQVTELLAPAPDRFMVDRVEVSYLLRFEVTGCHGPAY